MGRYVLCRHDKFRYSLWGILFVWFDILMAFLFWENDLWEVCRLRVVHVGHVVFEVCGWVVAKIDYNNWPSSSAGGFEQLV